MSWFLATDNVEGRFSGCTKRVMVHSNESAANSVYLVCHPLHRHTRAASPAIDMSASVAFSCRNISACVMTYEVVVRTNVPLTESFSQAEYPIRCITAEDGMLKQHIVANSKSQHSLHMIDVPASWVFL